MYGGGVKRPAVPLADGRRENVGGGQKGGGKILYLFFRFVALQDHVGEGQGEIPPLQELSAELAMVEAEDL